MARLGKKLRNYSPGAGKQMPNVPFKSNGGTLGGALARMPKPGAGQDAKFSNGTLSPAKGLTSTKASPKVSTPRLPSSDPLLKRGGKVTGSGVSQEKGREGSHYAEVMLKGAKYHVHFDPATGKRKEVLRVGMPRATGSTAQPTTKPSLVAPRRRRRGILGRV